MDKYEDILKKNIAFRLKLLREKFEIPISRLTEVLGVSRVQYYRYEKGEVLISTLGLKRIAEFYNVTLDYLTTNHTFLEKDAIFFNTLNIEDFKPLKEHYISDELGTIFFMKDGSTYLVFEELQNALDASGKYYFEYKHERFLGNLSSIANRDDEIMLLTSNSSQPKVVKRSDVYIIARLIGTYKDEIKDKFIQKDNS